MSRLTRDGTTEPVARDQNLRREETEICLFSLFQLTTSRIGNLTYYPVDLYSATYNM